MHVFTMLQISHDVVRNAQFLHWTVKQIIVLHYMNKAGFPFVQHCRECILSSDIVNPRQPPKQRIIWP
jgi:hypothetical protein